MLHTLSTVSIGVVISPNQINFSWRSRTRFSSHHAVMLIHFEGTCNRLQLLCRIGALVIHVCAEGPCPQRGHGLLLVFGGSPPGCRLHGARRVCRRNCRRRGLVAQPLADRHVPEGESMRIVLDSIALARGEPSLCHFCEKAIPITLQIVVLMQQLHFYVSTSTRYIVPTASLRTFNVQ